jgi:hypothetical protein
MKKITLIGTIVLMSALSPFIAKAAHPASDSVTMTGIVTCAHCGLSVPKGQTRMSWALQNVDHGDDIVLIIDSSKGFTTYRLSGHKDELHGYLGGTATVTGNLNGMTIEVASVESRKEH